MLIDMSDGTLRFGAVEGNGAITLTLDDIKRNLQVDGGYDDVLIGGLFTSAISALENMYGICILRRNVNMIFAEFGDRLVLKRANNMALGSIKYFDAFGDEQEFDLASVRLEQYMTNFESVHLRPSFSWPVHYGQYGEISINYVAGWAADDENWPQNIGQAINLLVYDWYKLHGDTSENKQYAIGNGVKALMGQFKTI